MASAPRADTSIPSAAHHRENIPHGDGIFGGKVKKHVGTESAGRWAGGLGGRGGMRFRSRSERLCKYRAGAPQDAVAGTERDGDAGAGLSRQDGKKRMQEFCGDEGLVRGEPAQVDTSAENGAQVLAGDEALEATLAAENARVSAALRDREGVVAEAVLAAGKALHMSSAAPTNDIDSNEDGNEDDSDDAAQPYNMRNRAPEHLPPPSLDTFLSSAAAPRKPQMGVARGKGIAGDGLPRKHWGSVSYLSDPQGIRKGIRKGTAPANEQEQLLEEKGQNSSESSDDTGGKRAEQLTKL